MGDDYLLPSIAAVVVGGGLITGGRGHYLGMLAGVLLLTALQTLLAGSNLPYATRAILYGLVVLGAVIAARAARLADSDRRPARAIGGASRRESSMANVAIIGAGLIGRAWALVYARGGHRVRLWDSQPAQVGQALAFAREVAPGLAQAGLLRGRTVDQLLAALEPVGRMEDALRDADYVQESTPERLDSKRRVYAELDRLAPAGAILASSTSALLPSHFTADLPGRARCLVAHPINPPYLVPAVEIVPAPWTDAACVERARSLLAEAGQQPIVMRREIDGFVVNRLQGALLHEAFRLVADGYAGVEDVDTRIRDGLALRWPSWARSRPST